MLLQTQETDTDHHVYRALTTEMEFPNHTRYLPIPSRTELLLP